MRKAGRKWRNALPFTCFFCLALTLAMGLYTWRYEPDRYRAEYAFFALPGGTAADGDALQLSRMLANDCNALLNTPGFQREVLLTAASDGHTRLYALPEADAHIIRVVAVGVDPAIVTGLANAAGQEMLRQAQSVLSATNGTEIALAVMPEAPFAPNRPLKTLAMLLGSFAGLSLLGMLFGSGRRPLRWKDGQAGPLDRAALPCLGGMANLDGLLRGYEKRKRRNAPSFYEEAGQTARESVREVAVALRAALNGAGCSVTVTGLGRDADTPAFSLLLASELAAESFDVLLIELDAYAPSLRMLLGVTGRMDVRDCLNSDSALKAALLPTAVPRLCFMDACHSPGFVATVAATDGFASFLRDAAHTFHFIILNAPPADGLSDAAMLGAVSDATVAVVRDGRYTSQELDALTRRLGQTAKRLTGFVLCGVPENRFPRDSRYRPAAQA